MRKKIETHKDNRKVRIILEDKSMASPWFMHEESLLKHIGKLVLKHGDSWAGYIKWRAVK